MSSVRMQLRSVIRNHPNLFRHPETPYHPKHLPNALRTIRDNMGVDRACTAGRGFIHLFTRASGDRAPGSPTVPTKGAGLDAYHGRGL
nr:MAG TPA: hypothetical protein [Caudoviricetes sp.]